MSPHAMPLTAAGAVLAAILLQSGNLSLEAASADRQNPPLMIRKQGSFLVGGKTVFTAQKNSAMPRTARGP